MTQSDERMSQGSREETKVLRDGKRVPNVCSTPFKSVNRMLVPLSPSLGTSYFFLLKNTLNNNKKHA